MDSRTLSLVLLTALTSSCSCNEEADATEELQAESMETLLNEQGAYAGSPVEYSIDVVEGADIIVTATTEDFDPIITVQAPHSPVLTNDDYRGSRTESRVRTRIVADGPLRVQVFSFESGATGAFNITIRASTSDDAPQAQTLVAGESIEGALETGDAVLADGRLSDYFVVSGIVGVALGLQIQAVTDEIPNSLVTGPTGQMLAPAENGQYSITEPGVHRIQILSATPGQEAGYRLSVNTTEGMATPSLARSNHRPPTTAGSETLALGQSVSGQLTSDVTLPSGEAAKTFNFPGTAGQRVRFELDSSAFDAYLMVISPTGQFWENDDSGGTRNSSLDVELPEAGNYRVVVTSYGQGETGAFELKSSAPRDTMVAAAGMIASNLAGAANIVGTGNSGSNGAAAGANTNQVLLDQQGSLQAGDQQLQSGEYFDHYEITLAAGQRVSIDARSSDFDTYLIVRPPVGNQTDNDDRSPPNTDAGLDLTATSAGNYSIEVTSYQAGETGSYTLQVVGAGAGPAVNTGSNNAAIAVNTNSGGASESGSLAQGDEQLNSGEFVDTFARTFTPGESVQIRLSSSDFDPYLIMQPPTGSQVDNDDFGGSRNSGIDIPSALPGEYRFLVTSYQPGETGRYRLSFGAGAPVPRPNRPNNGGGNVGAVNQNNGGARVFGLFVGISDYPDGVGDLPECANDAIKLHEALSNHGLTDNTRSVVLTDSQATVANVQSALSRLASQMGPNDVFVFFYSGHGGQTQSSSDPRELDGTDEFLVLHDGQLLDDTLAQQFDGVQAGTSVIALDSCYSGGFAKDLITRTGRMGLFSSEEDVLSAVASQFQAGGYLSHFFRTAVMGQADASPQDGVLTAGELTHYIYTQFGRHATDVELQGAYQHLVVDRGAVRTDQVLWAY